MKRNKEEPVGTYKVRECVLTSEGLHLSTYVTYFSSKVAVKNVYGKNKWCFSIIIAFESIFACILQLLKNVVILCTDTYNKIRNAEYSIFWFQLYKFLSFIICITSLQHHLSKVCTKTNSLLIIQLRQCVLIVLLDNFYNSVTRILMRMILDKFWLNLELRNCRCKIYDYI